MADFHTVMSLRISRDFHSACVEPSMGAERPTGGIARSPKVQKSLNLTPMQHLPAGQCARKADQAERK